MKKQFLFLSLLAALLGANTSFAAVIEYSDTTAFSGSHDYYPPGWQRVNSSFTLGSMSDTVLFPRFDPILGTLNSVTVTIESSATAISEVWYGVFQSSTLFNTVLKSKATSSGITAQAIDTEARTIPGQSVTTFTVPLTANNAQTETVSLAGFIGSGNVSVARTSDVSLTHPASNYFDLLYYNFSASVTARLTYDYEVPVPEPTTMFLLGTGLIGLAGLRRRFSVG